MNTDVLTYIKDIIPLIEKFLQNKSEYNENWLLEFSLWLKSIQDDHIADGHIGKKYNDILIGMHLINTSNLVKTRFNKFVTESPFATFMDFQFLYILKEHHEMTKSELISANFMEMSSGIEVIKRLLKHNWISEKPNPKDGRSKLISVTIEGEKLILKYNDSAQKIYTSFSTNLDNQQKVQFLEMLSHFNSDTNNS